MIETSDRADMETRDVDQYVGQRLREKRVLCGLSQEALGRCVDVTFQQIQKYEQGVNRISASKLYQFSRVFDEPVGAFFAGLPGQPGKTEPAGREALLSSTPISRETLECVRLFFKIEDPRLRKEVKSLLQTLQTHPKG